MSREEFWEIGCQICQHHTRKDNINGNRKYRNFFGTSPTVCVQIWENIHCLLSGRKGPKHLLCALLFLRQYHDEMTNAAIIGSTEKTLRSWIQEIVPLIAWELNVVCCIIFSL
jgi:hypothetical protein